MEKKRTKYFFLLWGIFLGFFVGAFAVWGIQKYNIRFFMSINPLESINRTEDTEKISLVAEQEKPSKKKTVVRNPVSTDNNVVYAQDDEFSTDTIYYTSASYEDVEVARDELLFINNVKIKSINTDSKRVDSLLIDDNLVMNPYLRVEFWKSPINYSGYKLGNNKLVLFGVYEPEKMKLEQTGDQLLMIYKGLAYELQQSEEFVQLDKVKKHSLKN